MNRTAPRRRQRPPSLQVLRDPAVLAALQRAAAECIEDGDGCENPRDCSHPANQMSPQDFVDWILLHTKPPPRPRPALSQDRRARWKRRQAASRRTRDHRQVAELADVA